VQLRAARYLIENLRSIKSPRKTHYEKPRQANDQEWHVFERVYCKSYLKLSRYVGYQSLSTS
jgi:hypothetical protein